MSLQPFHIAIPVNNLTAARRFYGELLGCPEGRSSSNWIDFDFFGHQITVHAVEGSQSVRDTNPVDGADVPVPHFGIVMEWEQWHRWTADLQARGHPFAIAPTIRFQGQVGEQATCFFDDPAGNSLEFKAFKNLDALFATDE